MVVQSSYDLDVTDYHIFLTLQRDPEASNTTIANQIQVSPETVRTRLHRLKERGFLRPQREITDPVLGARIQSEVEASYDPARLGLTRYHVFLEGIATGRNSERIREIFDQHPYTHYWSRCYAHGGGYFAEFDAPQEVAPLLEELLNRIKEMELCREYMIYPSEYRVRSKVNFQQWDIRRQHWDLDDERYSHGGNLIENLWQYFLREEYDETPTSPGTPEPASFDDLDLKLLRELTINSKLSLTSIKDHYDKDISTISKRVKRIREDIITDNVLFYNRRIFDITYAQTIVGRFKPDGITRHELIQFVESGLLPFTSGLSISDNSFVWYQSLPPFFASTISEFIWKNFQLDNIYQLQLEKTMRYYFYHKNYDSDTGWQTDRSYVLDDVISILK